MKRKPINRRTRRKEVRLRLLEDLCADVAALDDDGLTVFHKLVIARARRLCRKGCVRG